MEQVGWVVEMENLTLTCYVYEACWVLGWRCCVGRYVNLMSAGRWDRKYNFRSGSWRDGASRPMLSQAE